MKVAVYNIFGTGHIHPTLPFVKELTNKGAEVIYYTSPMRKDMVEAAGASFRNYGSDDYKAANYNPGKNFVLQQLPATAGILPYLRSECEKFAPDVILYDSMAPWGYCLSQIYQIPAVCSVSTFALSPGRRQGMYDFYGIKIDDVNEKAILEIKEQHGVSLELIHVLGSYNDCNLVLTSKEFNPPLEMEEKHFHFVGPIIAERQHVDFPLEKIKNSGKKIIYMSLGTVVVGEDPTLVEVFKIFLDAVGKDERFLAVVSIGRELELEALGEIPDNCMVYHFVPQLEILKFADVFVHHSGTNSINEGLYFNVPCVTIPISNDQFTNAARVEELQVGIQLKRNTLTPALLQQAIVDILEKPLYQDNCARISADFANCIGFEGALQMILDIMNRRSK